MYMRVVVGVRRDNDEWAAHRKDMLALTTTRAHLAEIGRKPMNPQRTKNTDNVPYTVDPEPAHPTTYTYVALELGRLWIQLKDGRWAHTQINHHVTLSYLPGMSPLSMRTLQSDLQGMLNEWRKTRATPEKRSRNTDIMWRRHAIVQSGEGTYDDDVTYVISDLTLDQIKHDLATKTVYLGGRVLAEEKPDDVLRLYWRDMGRQLDADARAAGLCQADEGDLMDVPLTGCNVQQKGELYDLLEYAWERLVYRHGVYHLHPVNEVGVHHRHSWHVSIEDSPAVVIV